MLRAAFSEPGALARILPAFLNSPYGTPPTFGTKEYLKAYADMPWLQAVTNKMAWGLSEAEWTLYKGTRKRRTSPQEEEVSEVVSLRDYAALTYGDRNAFVNRRINPELLDVTEIMIHPCLKLLREPNSVLSGVMLKRITQIYLDLVGEAFWLKERGPLGTPTQLWPIPPHWVTGTPLPSRPFFTLGIYSKPIEVPTSEIVWFFNPNPEFPYGRGVGIAHALSDELETDEYAAKHSKMWFLNRARPDLLIFGDGLSQPDTERLEERWMQRSQGFWKSFKPLFLNKTVQVKELSHTFENMQLVQLRTALRDTIRQVAGGIPPEIMGILDSSNRATIEAADYLFSRWVLIPRLEQQRATIQTQLVNDFDDRLLLHYRSPVMEDKQFVLAAAKAAPWSLTINDWREIQGKKRFPGAQGDTLVLPGGYYLLPITEDGSLATPIVPQLKPSTSPTDDEGEKKPEEEDDDGKEKAFNGTRHAN